LNESTQKKKESQMCQKWCCQFNLLLWNHLANWYQAR